MGRARLAWLDQPNILSIFDTSAHHGSPYLVSQFLEGTTLREEQSAPVRMRINFWKCPIVGA